MARFICLRPLMGALALALLLATPSKLAAQEPRRGGTAIVVIGADPAILPAHVFRGSDVLRNPASHTQPVGQGPFQLTEWVRGDHLTLVRNPTYWTKDQPYLDRIVIKIIPDSSARLLALQAGEVDYID